MSASSNPEHSSMIPRGAAMVRALKFQPLVDYLAEFPRPDHRIAAVSARLRAVAPYERVPLALFSRLFEQAALLCDDPALGATVGHFGDGDRYPIVRILLANARTLSDAIEGLHGLTPIIQDTTATHLERSGDLAAMSYRVIGMPHQEGRQDREFSLMQGCGFLRARLKPDWAPIEVHFEHPLPPSTRHRQIVQALFRCPVLYGQTGNRMIFEAGDLAAPVRPLTREDASLRPYLLKQLDTMRAECPQADFLDDVRIAISANLGHVAMSLASVAERMGTSERTLQRRLRERRVTFRELLQSARIERARRLLTQQGLSIGEIALAVGYEDGASFSRAFKAQTGLPPRRYGVAAA